jgi:hypothetical protein
MNRQNHKTINLPGMGQMQVDSLPQELRDKINDLPLEMLEGEREELSKEERKKRTKRKKAIKKQKRKNR